MARFFLALQTRAYRSSLLDAIRAPDGLILNLRSGVRVGSRICEHTAEGSALPAWGGSQVEFGRLRISIQRLPMLVLFS